MRVCFVPLGMRKEFVFEKGEGKGERVGHETVASSVSFK